MSTPNRATLIAKLQKVLKKHYKPVAAPVERSLLEQILYACCLENSKNDAADVAFARLQETYFDWNEVRVTTVTELTEVMNNLADAQSSARRLKQSLQSIFEMHYSFDIETMAKQNLGKSVKELSGHKGITPFVLSYVVQHGLSGHSVPINRGALDSLHIVGVITDNEHKKRQVPGMERAISQDQGAGVWLTVAPVRRRLFRLSFLSQNSGDSAGGRSGRQGTDAETGLSKSSGQSGQEARCQEVRCQETRRD